MFHQLYDSKVWWGRDMYRIVVVVLISFFMWVSTIRLTLKYLFLLSMVIDKRISRDKTRATIPSIIFHQVPLVGLAVSYIVDLIILA